MRRVITLTTDFGIDDAYVASMKGVILSINPEANIVDISHAIKPQDILQAAFTLSTTHHFFPSGTTHVVVVDPGVGSDRKALLVRTPLAYYIAPDNGVLSYALHEFLPDAVVSNDSGIPKPRSLPLAAPAEAWILSNPAYWNHTVSSTFHGRDIFASVAAHLSTGIPVTELGSPTGSITAYPLLQPFIDSDGTTIGIVLHIDIFGNIITNIRREDISSQNVTMEIGERHIEGISRFYAEKDGFIALIDSSNYLEIALKNGNAASTIGISIGDTVKIWPT